MRVRIKISKNMSGNRLIIVKIGGNVIDNSEKLHNFLKDFAAINGPKILVHGGGKAATDMGISMGITPQMIDGRRVTDIETLRIVTMVYAGLINKNLVAQLQAKGCNAIGLSGADGNLITATKRTPKTSPVSNQQVDYGFVGDLNASSVNTTSLQKLLNAGFVPVFSAITHDGDTQLLNTNADTIASAVAVAASAQYDTHLVYCFEKKGVLADVNDETSVIREIRPQEFEELKNKGIVAEGMIPKLTNAFSAIENGVTAVYIGKADDLSEIETANFGTRIIK